MILNLQPEYLEILAENSESEISADNEEDDSVFLNSPSAASGGATYKDGVQVSGDDGTYGDCDACKEGGQKTTYLGDQGALVWTRHKSPDLHPTQMRSTQEDAPFEVGPFVDTQERSHACTHSGTLDCDTRKTPDGTHWHGTKGTARDAQDVTHRYTPSAPVEGEKHSTPWHDTHEDAQFDTSQNGGGTFKDGYSAMDDTRGSCMTSPPDVAAGVQSTYIIADEQQNQS